MINSAAYSNSLFTLLCRPKDHESHIMALRNTLKCEELLDEIKHLYQNHDHWRGIYDSMLREKFKTNRQELWDRLRKKGIQEYRVSHTQKVYSLIERTQKQYQWRSSPLLDLKNAQDKRDLVRDLLEEEKSFIIKDIELLSDTIFAISQIQAKTPVRVSRPELKLSSIPKKRVDVKKKEWLDYQNWKKGKDQDRQRQRVKIYQLNKNLPQSNDENIVPKNHSKKRLSTHKHHHQQPFEGKVLSETEKGYKSNNNHPKSFKSPSSNANLKSKDYIERIDDTSKPKPSNPKDKHTTTQPYCEEKKKLVAVDESLGIPTTDIEVNYDSDDLSELSDHETEILETSHDHDQAPYGSYPSVPNYVNQIHQGSYVPPQPSYGPLSTIIFQQNQVIIQMFQENAELRNQTNMLSASIAALQNQVNYLTGYYR